MSLSRRGYPGNGKPEDAESDATSDFVSGRWCSSSGFQTSPEFYKGEADRVAQQLREGNFNPWEWYGEPLYCIEFNRTMARLIEASRS